MSQVNKKFILLLLVLLTAVKGEARTTDVAVIREKIHQICPDALIVDTEFREGFTEVEFMCANQKMEAGFDINNNLVYTEREVRLSGELYGKIRKKLDKAWVGWIVDDIHLVETGDTSFYSAELIKNGLEENVYFSTDGKYYRPATASDGGLWTVGELNKAYRNEQVPYNFLKPSRIYEMPDVLREISGITMASGNRMYLVQDELGALFVYDLNKEEVEKIIRFTDTGDFEDVASNNREAYVLRSDGTIFSFSTGKPEAEPQRERVPVQSLDNEGLFFDRSQNLLYLAGKSRPENGDSNYRLIYRMKPGELHDAEVYFAISLEEINKLIKKEFPHLAEEKKHIEFNPSAIAVHPDTGEMYVLSANERLLAVYDTNSRLKQVFPLPAEIYHKPEGLAFAENGDMYISSEGIKNGYLKGRILMLKHDPLSRTE